MSFLAFVALGIATCTVGRALRSTTYGTLFSSHTGPRKTPVSSGGATLKLVARGFGRPDFTAD